MNAYINGEQIAFEANETILEVARRSGHYIPTLCELADIDHTPGTCRVCLVEIRCDGQEKQHRHRMQHAYVGRYGGLHPYPSGSRNAATSG